MLIDEPSDDLSQNARLAVACGNHGFDNPICLFQRPASSIPAFRKAGVGFTHQCLKQICSTGLFGQVGRTLTVQPLQVDGIRYFDDSPRRAIEKAQATSEKVPCRTTGIGRAMDLRKVPFQITPRLPGGLEAMEKSTPPPSRSARSTLLLLTRNSGRG